MRVVRSLAFLAVAVSLGHTAEAQPVTEEAYSSTTIAKYYVCNVLIPNATQTVESSNRIGAVASFNVSYAAPQERGKPYRGVVLTQDLDKPWCSPDDKYALPNDDRYQKLSSIPKPGRQRFVDAGATFRLEITKFFEALNFSIENVQAVSMIAEDVKAYTLAPGRQEDVVKALLAQGNTCKSALSQANARLITRICTGTLTTGVFFRTAVKGDVLNIAVANLIKAGANLRYVNEESSVAPCGPAASPPGGGQTSTQQTGKPAVVAKSKTDPSPKQSAVPTVSFSVKTASAAVGGTVTPTAASATPGSTLATPATPATPEAPAATKSDKAEPAKCYSYALLVGPQNGVFGVNLSPTEGNSSLKALVKRLQNPN